MDTFHTETARFVLILLVYLDQANLFPAYISVTILVGRQLQDADVRHGQSPASSSWGDLDKS